MALRFNRPFSHPIKAISFDLDDTLYFNEEVIQKAEYAQYQSLCQRVPAAAKSTPEFWIELKWHIAKTQPDLCHDVEVWRRAVIKTGLTQFAPQLSNLDEIVEQVFDDFYDARSDFEVPKQTFEVLDKLSRVYPLVAATNGNADINRLGLAPYFVGYYRAGEQGTRMKPYPDMLHLAAQHLDIPVENILHIGDNEGSDIQAALNAGCASLWFNSDGREYKSGYCLADGEYNHLDDLLQLL